MSVLGRRWGVVRTWAAVIAAILLLAPLREIFPTWAGGGSTVAGSPGHTPAHPRGLPLLLTSPFPSGRGVTRGYPAELFGARMDVGAPAKDRRGLRGEAAVDSWSPRACSVCELGDGKEKRRWS